MTTCKSILSNRQAVAMLSEVYIVTCALSIIGVYDTQEGADEKARQFNARGYTESWHVKAAVEVWPVQQSKVRRNPC